MYLKETEIINHSNACKKLNKMKIMNTSLQLARQNSLGCSGREIFASNDVYVLGEKFELIISEWEVS